MDAYPAVRVSPTSTSYFSEPEEHLDPHLFAGMDMHPEVRADLCDRLMNTLASYTRNADKWVKLWLAGSGASYQWSAARQPGDLDMLIGINYPVFRQFNPAFTQLSNAEISTYVTDKLRERLTPYTARWSPPNDTAVYEVTWFSNPESTDIRDIHPYAAYELFGKTWDVPPDPNPARPAHSPQAERDVVLATKIVDRYTRAQQAMENQANEILRKQAETIVKESLKQATALFDEIHEGRHAAFGWGGNGYADPANHRWQAGKASGAIPALLELRQFHNAERSRDEIRTYGVELQSVDTLLLRALTAQNPEDR